MTKAKFVSFEALGKFLRRSRSVRPEVTSPGKQLSERTSARKKEIRPATKPGVTLTKGKAPKLVSAKKRPAITATAKPKSPSAKGRDRVLTEASSQRETRRAHTISDDRKSLHHFDRRLAAGPDVPTNLPTSDDIEAIRERNTNSVARFGHRVEADENVTDVIIGLDVGSTATKLVLRLPYSEDIGLPVPAPTWFRADDHPYYWRTLLWKSEGGQFSIDPCKDATPLDRLKVDLLNFEYGDRKSIKIAMVAWIVLMARQGIGWLRSEQPRLFRRGRVVVDEVNLGMPFTNTDETHPDQRQIADAAGRMLEAGEVVTEDTILLALDPAAPGRSDLVELQPELAGALHGFLRSHQRRDGRYLLADIGGLTVDTVFFRYREAAERPITVFSKSVEPFGSDVVSRWCEETGSTERATNVLGNHLAEVSKAAIHEKMHVFADDRGKPLELETILIGGGRHSEPHQASIDWCENSMRRSVTPLDLRPRALEPDRDDLDAPLARGKGIGRLLVAMGLSYSRHDAPDIRPPSEVPDVERLKAKDVSEVFVGPEQC